MKAPRTFRSRLVDAPDESGRTTATLIASLAARLASLHGVTGAQAVGSLVAGFAALGREVSKTADGTRIRRALDVGRPGTNGNALWAAFHLEEWTLGLPASPVLDFLYNDVALLLAADTIETLALLPIPGEVGRAEERPREERTTFLDCVVGLWAFASSLRQAVEALAAPKLLPDNAVLEPEGPRPAEPSSVLLR